MVGPSRPGGGEAPPPPARGGRFGRAISPRGLWAASLGTGGMLTLLGLLSASVTAPAWYGGPLLGYDPPFDIVSGLLILGVSSRLRGGSRVAWLFGVFAGLMAVGISVLSPTALSIAGAALAAVLVGLLVASETRFSRSILWAGEAAEFAILLAALLSLLYGVVGARWLGGQFAPRPGIQSWTEALYFTVTTISTNGSNYEPLTDAARLYTVFLVLAGVGTFLSAVVVLFLPFLEGRLQRVARRLEQGDMAEISGHVIVCGGSPEVRAIAERLRDVHVPALILGAPPAAAHQFATDGFRVQGGEPSSEETLRLVGIERARALVAADSSEAENLLTVITARGISQKLFIIALAASPGSVPKFQRAGANEVVNPVSVAAQLVIRAALERV